MTDIKFNTALIVGAGSGLSASLARLLTKEGLKVALAARSTGDLDRAGQGDRRQGLRLRCQPARRRREAVRRRSTPSIGAPDIVIYNASYRTRGPFVDLDPAEVEKAIAVTAYGAFLVAQQAARRMLPKKHGAILLTGASAGVKGYAAVGAVRDGQVRAARARAEHGARAVAAGHPCRACRDRRRHQERTPAGAAGSPDSLLDPDAIAATYMHLIQQPRSAWAWEIELRPWVEQNSSTFVVDA